ISSSTPIGSIVGKVRAVAGSHIITYRTSSQLFDVDSWGNVILTGQLDPSGTREVVVTASTPFRSSTTLLKIEITADLLTETGHFSVEENSVGGIITVLDENYQVLLTVPQTSAFVVQNKQLVLTSPLDHEMSSTYQVLVGNNSPPVLPPSSFSSTHLLTVDVIDVNDNDPVCDVTTFLAYESPFSTTLSCTDPDTGDKSTLSYRVTSSGATVTDNGRLSVHLSNETVTTVYVDVSDGKDDNSKRTKTILVHVILSIKNDPGISFPSKEISMLMTSSQPVGTKLGRITAESALPIKYYVVGSSLIRVNEDTGVVSTRRLARKDETATIVAVSSRGVASVKLNVEVIEDQLILPRQRFLFAPRSLTSGQSLGSIDLGRDDVSIDLSDPYLYIRGNELSLKKDLQFIGAHFYNCSAHVWKGRVSADIEIYVLPPSTETTYTTNGHLEFWIRENAPYGSVVGRVPEGANKSGAPTYSIIGEAGLSIDPQSGILKTATVFDHETQQLYSFKLRSTYPSGEFIDQDAILLIDDENDNIPKFEQDTYGTEIEEDIEIGAEILQLRWTDRDFNNAFHLSTIEGNELSQFEVGQEGRITVSKPLDREQLSSHRLVIRLSDGIAPYPYHTTECTVVINLIDINDNAPVFISQTEFQVEENSHRMKVVGRVRAVDADSDRNAQISYRILPESLPWAEFIIDAVHGDIMVNKPLDYEQKQNYTFIVVAMDYGMPQLQSEQEITVYVVDTNDHDPIISSNLTVVDVNEVAPRGTVIANFRVEDKDTAENSASVFEIVEDYGIFDVSPISGQLSLALPLDFEAQSEYNVTVSARNIAGGTKSFTSIIVRVIDNNDEAPRFISGSPVHFSVVENLPGPYPAVIGSTISEDLDEGENGLVTYSIFKGNTTLFSINSATGEVLVLAPLDREETTEHFLTAQATDSGSPRLSATSEIKITVLDDNDNAPEFDQPYYIVHVRENSKIGTEVLHVNATDKDEGRNGLIRYSLLGESPFSIDPVTGAITIAGEVDREASSRYHMRIQATDYGKYKRQISIAYLTVIIDDGNDNNPVIRNKFLDVYIPNDLRAGDVVYVVDAVDSDEDNTLFYNLTGKSLGDKAYYSITVAVFDAGGLNTSASFTFYVDDYRKFPKWIATQSEANLIENSFGEIFQFKAQSPRNGSYFITYSILSGNDGSFSIDPLSGQLSISSELDRERRSIYRLWMAATDSDSPAKTSLTSISVVVEDKNDNSPVFDKVIYAAEILENSDAQQLVCVSAFDSDLGKNAKISYSIASGNLAEAFTIDSSTGCIKTMRSLDREETSNYRLAVLATDHGVPPLNAEALVKVEVLDEDDNAPKFSHLFHAEVYEDLKVGSPVLLISATDPDEHDNHTFSIDNETDIPFSIDNRTGQIWLRQPLDREKESSYRLRVRVSDGTWTVQTGAAISVLDVNDNAPVFEKNQYVLIVNGSQVGQAVGWIHAFDADDGINGNVSYRFEQDVRCLSIDAVSGDVRLLEVPDRGVVTATVIAQDNGVPAMTSSALVTIVFPSKRAPDCEIPVNVGTLNGTRLGRLEDYCGRIIGAKNLNATRQFSSEHSCVRIDGGGNLLISRDFPEGTDDVIIDFITELENGSAVVRAVKLEMSQGNEHSPQFVEKIFHFTISEDVTKGHLVGAVNATDADVGLSGKINYIMQSERDVPLCIHPNGSIIVSGILDYEMKKRYVFNVTATDHGQPPRKASAQVVVDLLDVNDNTPMLEDKELIYAVTSADDVICPAVSDIDTPNSDLEFFIDSSEAVTVTQHGCLKLDGTVPAAVSWTVSDDNQPVTARVKLLDMIPRKPDIRDEDVTISENSVDDTVVVSYGSVVFVEHSDQLSTESKDIKVKGGRGVHNETRTIYAKSKFGRIVRR
ncbi:cadherin domain protein, partial [Oesophagostomum dentatum]